MNAETEWTPLASALDQLEAVVREQEPLPANPSPYRRRAWAVSCREWAQKIIDFDWRTGCLAIKATTFRELPAGATEHVVTHDREVPPEFGEWAFFNWETLTLAQRTGRRTETGLFEEVVLAEASGILINRAGLDERLAYMRSKIGLVSGAAASPQPQRMPVCLGDLVAYLHSVADGTTPEPELKAKAKEHFPNNTIPDKSRWRPALKALPAGALLKPGQRQLKSGN